MRSQAGLLGRALACVNNLHAATRLGLVTEDSELHCEVTQSAPGPT